MAERVRIGDMLVAAGLVTAAQVDEALARQKTSGRRLGEELVALGFVGEVQLTQILSNQLSVPWVSLRHVEFSRDLLSHVSAETAERYCLIPIYVRRVRKAGDILFIAMDDPTKQDAIAAVQAGSSLPVKPMVAPPSEIRNAIRVFYFGGRPTANLPAGPGDQPIGLRAPPPPPPASRSEAATHRLRREGGVLKLGEPLGKERPAVPPPEAAPPAPAPEPQRPTEPSAKKKKKRATEPPAAAKKGKPRMITMTLLDGTTVRLPTPKGATGGDDSEAQEEEEEASLTASDLVAALLARSQGADVSDVLKDERWEPLVATLLRILLRKGLVADWEFVEEWNRLRG